MTDAEKSESDILEKFLSARPEDFKIALQIEKAMKKRRISLRDTLFSMIETRTLELLGDDWVPVLKPEENAEGRPSRGIKSEIKVGHTVHLEEMKLGICLLALNFKDRK